MAEKIADPVGGREDVLNLAMANDGALVGYGVEDYAIAIARKPRQACPHRTQGVDPYPGCPACSKRVRQAAKLDERHYGRAILPADDELLDEDSVIDLPAA